MARIPKNVMPKGVRKGGTRFPRQPLTDALGWSKKLVIKTHLSPQPRDVILSGVVGASSSIGEIRISSLKQYGLIEGDSKAYAATQLAKSIESAPSEEQTSFLRSAALTPSVFKSLFDTFQGDKVSIAKLRQRASELAVHPEEAEKCVDNYVTSIVIASLAKIEGDKVNHISAAEMSNTSSVQDRSAEQDGVVDGDFREDAIRDDDIENSPTIRRQRAVFNVSINLDASLDAEKLEKQLKLLKRYGAI